MLKTYYTADNRLFYNKHDMKRNLLIAAYVLIGLFIGACIGLYVSVMTMPIEKPNVVYLRSQP